MKVTRRYWLIALAVMPTTFGATSTSMAAGSYFEYSDTAGDTAWGQLTFGSSGLNDGSFHITGGFIDVTASANSNVATGIYPVQPIGPTPTVTPSGLLEVDNLVYPLDNAASGTNSGLANTANPSYLTNWGLYFGPPGATGTQSEVNLWGNGHGDYAFYTVASGAYVVTAGTGGTFVLAPEPASLLMAGIVGALAVGYRMRRRRQA